VLVLDRDYKPAARSCSRTPGLAAKRARLDYLRGLSGSGSDTRSAKIHADKGLTAFCIGNALQNFSWHPECASVVFNRRAIPEAGRAILLLGEVFRLIL
jgi:hypothetical protein